MIATPTVKRRLASMAYESILLFFCVLPVAIAMYFIVERLISYFLPQHSALSFSRALLQGWLFLSMAIYFSWFWCRGGQTLAMKTWRIRLLTTNDQTVSATRAVYRYLLAWFWILPGLVLAWILNIATKNWMLVLIPIANIILWAIAALLDPQRQFLHDRLAGTRLIDASNQPKKL